MYKHCNCVDQDGDCPAYVYCHCYGRYTGTITYEITDTPCTN
jgi:hypothetical protein